MAPKQQGGARPLGSAPVNVLTPAFLSERGVPMTTPLQGWLTRAAFIARTRPSPAERERYERWAVNIVQDALAAPGGSASFPWAKTSPVMPTDAADSMPSLLLPRVTPTVVQAPAIKAGAAVGVASSSATVARDALRDECMRRAPVGLRPFIQQAIEEKDTAMRVGTVAQDVFARCTFLEILARATEMQNSERASSSSSAPVAPPTAVEQLVFASEPVPLPSPSGSASPARRSQHVVTASVERPPKRPRHNEDFSMVHVTGETNRFYAALLCDNDSLMTSGVSQDHGSIQGTSTAMERLYSRHEPVAEDIRPPRVLVSAFAHVQRAAAAKEQLEGRAAALHYLNEQLKGMRQDLRVQNVASTFAVTVYELHAAVALERGDVGEFNQCQSALKSLYASPDVDKKQCRVADFFYYRLVYLCLSRQYDALSTELITYTNATHRAKGDRGVADYVSRRRVRSCLQLCASCEDGDVVTLCRSLATFSVSMAHLVRIYLSRLRVGWIDDLLRAVKGPITLSFLLFHLGFVGQTVSGLTSNQTAAPRPVIWLDGSAEAAASEWVEFFSRLKIDLPRTFSVTADTTAARKDLDLWGEKDASHSATLDAATAYTAVQAYMSYLTARRDVTLDV